MDQHYSVIELRRYTIKPDQRSAFARYFESYFPEAFQQLGASVIGHFLERGQSDRFTWLRGYAGMDARLAVNQAFYQGPVWAEHKRLLNAMMVDSDDVLLLCPAVAQRGVRPARAPDPVGEPDGATGIAVAQIFDLRADLRDALLDRATEWFDAYRGRGAVEAAILKTLDVANNFPQHPIRTDGSYIVWVGLVPDQQALDGLRPLLDAAAAALAASGMLRGETELVIMDPAARSRLRWTGTAS
jgi:hypothetical protein